jgi:hypothetical protein
MNKYLLRYSSRGKGPPKNLLAGTRCYLIGSIEYGDAETWRNQVTKAFNEMNIRCYDPLNKPFILDFDETPAFRANMIKWRDEGKYDKLSKHMKQIRISDLSLVDKSDFLICYIDLDVLTIGSWEEFFQANKLKRPIFLIIKQGKKKCPTWIFGTIPHKYIYDSIEQAVDMIRAIDAGKKPIDSDRWKLLRPEWR